MQANWIEKTSTFWYRRVGQTQTEFILVDAERNTSAPAFDHSRLAAGLSRAAKRAYDPSRLPFDSFEFVQSGKAIRLKTGDGLWICDVANYECRSSPPENPNEALSPNKQWSAYVKDHNLYMRNVSTGQAQPLTQDGVSGWDYATPLPSLRVLVEQGTENPRQAPAVFWSPDSSKLISYRIDSRNAGRFTSLQFVPPDQLRPRPFTYVYPLPGEVLPTAVPIVFDVQTGSRTDVKTLPLELPFQDGPEFQWLPDSKSIFYDYDQRGFKTREFRVINAETGEQRVVISDHSDRYVDPGETSFRLAPGAARIFWTSERDGWNQLYAASLKTGELENQLTHGPWVVREISYVDEVHRVVYFLASGREKNEDPYLEHLYKVGFDGSGLTLLTPENAEHAVSVSPDGSFFVDNYSRVDLPGQSVLRRSKDGSEVRVLEKSDATALLASGWKFPEAFQGKAAGGTTAPHGLVLRPSNLDPSKQYSRLQM